MVPHQHLTILDKGWPIERIKAFVADPNRRDLEEWVCISDAPSEGPSAIDALMMKSRDTQDSGSNEAAMEEKNKFEEGMSDGEPGEQKAK